MIRNLTPAISSFLLLIASSLFATPAAAQTFATADGNLVEVTLKPDKEVIMLGETTFLSFEVKNHSGQDLCMGEGGDYRNSVGRPDSFRVTVVRDDGKAVPQPEVKFSMGGLYGCSRIPAHGSRTVKLFLPHWATFEAAGSYSIRVARGLSITNYSTKSESSAEADVTTTLKVVPTDGRMLGEVIDLLGSRMLDAEHPESGRAIAALAFIDDERAIKYFAQALERFVRAPDRASGRDRIGPTASALSQFNDDLALAALEKEMDSRDDEIRRDIASALRRSRHPRAVGLLMKMRRDSYYGVRLEVAFALGRVENDRSDSVLREMLKDENEYVRNAARQYLSERGRR